VLGSGCVRLSFFSPRQYMRESGSRSGWFNNNNNIYSTANGLSPGGSVIT